MSLTERASDVSAIDDDRDIELLLRRYAAEHPGAADTLRGIVMFWLGLPPTPSNLTGAERVLQRLEGEGLLRSRLLGGSARLWTVRPE
jgi:hypothetical protein